MCLVCRLAAPARAQFGRAYAGKCHPAGHNGRLMRRRALSLLTESAFAFLFAWLKACHEREKGK
jgi:hypothetical protein